MSRLCFWRNFAVSACLLALCGCALLEGRATQADACADCPDGPNVADAETPPVPLGDKLGAHLLALVEGHAAGGLEQASSYAQSKDLDLREGRVSVQVLAESEQDVPSLERRILGVGGSVQSRFENSIFAAIPLPALAAFAADEAVWRINAEQRAYSPQAPDEANQQHTGEANQ